MLGRNSGVSGAKYTRVRELPVLTATYCRPSTANVIGNPVIGEPRFTSHNTSPVSASRARNRPLRSPPNTSPPPVATSEVVAARCSYFQASSPVSGEMA